MSVKSATVALSTVVLLCGCVSTTIKRHPGQHDKGVRFYRPKPYLVIQPAVVNNVIQANAVSIALDWLPDFQEEYSVHICSGAGINHTTLTLENGWNLTKITYDLDSQTAENINAVGELVEVAKAFAPTGGNAPQAAPPTSGELQVLSDSVPARNVPIGYYESVLGVDGCGKKRLYGWRYVGFSPYEPCPICPSGVVPQNCNEQALYGLIAERGVMVFKRLNDLANTDVTPQPRVATRMERGALYDVVAKELQAFIGHVNTTFANDPTVQPSLTHDTPADGEVVFKIRLAKHLDDALVSDLKKLWASQLRATLAALTEGYVATVKEVEVHNPPSTP